MIGFGGVSIRSFVLAFIVGLSAARATLAGSIAASDLPVASLADGRTGTIAFRDARLADASTVAMLHAAHRALEPGGLEGDVAFCKMIGRGQSA